MLLLRGHREVGRENQIVFDWQRLDWAALPALVAVIRKEMRNSSVFQRNQDDLPVFEKPSFCFAQTLTASQFF